MFSGESFYLFISFNYFHSFSPAPNTWQFIPSPCYRLQGFIFWAQYRSAEEEEDFLKTCPVVIWIPWWCHQHGGLIWHKEIRQLHCGHEEPAHSQWSRRWVMDWSLCAAQNSALDSGAWFCPVLLPMHLLLWVGSFYTVSIKAYINILH